MHRLFEGQGWKEGHFSVHFGSQEGTLVRVLAPKRAVYHVLTSQRGSLVCFANQEGTLACFFGSQEGTLACVLAPKRALKQVFFASMRAVYHVVTSQGGSLVCFAKQEGTLAHVGSQEGTLACPPCPPPCAYHGSPCSMVCKLGVQSKQVSSYPSSCRPTLTRLD